MADTQRKETLENFMKKKLKALYQLADKGRKAF